MRRDPMPSVIDSTSSLGGNSGGPNGWATSSVRLRAGSSSTTSEISSVAARGDGQASGQ